MVYFWLIQGCLYLRSECGEVVHSFWKCFWTKQWNHIFMLDLIFGVDERKDEKLFVLPNGISGFFNEESDDTSLVISFIDPAF